MKNFDLKLLILSLTTALVTFFEPIEVLLASILWLVLIDIITGAYLVRIVNKEPLTSRGFFKKLPQVAKFLVAVVAALHADPFFVQFGLPQYQAASLVISFYGLYELFSILENLGKSGLPVAKQITSILSAKLPTEIKNGISEVKQ